MDATRSARAGSPWMTVVGVIANARTASLADASVPQLYLDLYQTGGRRLAIWLRGHMDAAAIPDDMRKQVQSVDPTLPTLPAFGAQMLHDTVSAFLAERRFSMQMVGLFAFTALMLAGLGVDGVAPCGTSNQTSASFF